MRDLKEETDRATKGVEITVQSVLSSIATAKTRDLGIYAARIEKLIRARWMEH
jgi:hypothetical protein